VPYTQEPSRKLLCRSHISPVVAPLEADGESFSQESSVPLVPLLSLGNWVLINGDEKGTAKPTNETTSAM